MHDSSFSGPKHHLQERLIPKSLAIWDQSFVSHSHLHRLWWTLPAVVAAGAQVTATDPDQRVHGSLRPQGDKVVLYLPKTITSAEEGRGGMEILGPDRPLRFSLRDFHWFQWRNVVNFFPEYFNENAYVRSDVLLLLSLKRKESTGWTWVIFCHGNLI